MTTTATYMSDLGRIRVAFTSAPAAADYAKVERSIDGITWTTVRGGDTVAVVAGAGKVDDYEFVAGVLNTYRVSFVDNGPISMVPAAGTAVSGNNASLNPPLPASGLLDGDALYCWASIRNSGTGTPNTPTGWAKVVDMGNAVLFSRRYATGVTAPTISFTGGAAGADTLAQITGFHNANPVPLTYQTLSNPSAQNVTVPAVTVSQGGTLDMFLGWKQNSWTGAADPRAYAEIGDWFSAAGSTAAMWWEYTVQADNSLVSFTSQAITVTGGVSAISSGASIVFVKAPWVTQDTVTITPTLTSAWFKVPSRPSLNTPVTISWDGQVSRPSRTGVFDVLGRTYPVAVTDVQGSRRLTLTFITQTVPEANDLDRRLNLGEPVFIQAPAPNSSVPTLYAVMGDITQTRPSNRAKRRYFVIPLIEVATPGSTVYSDTYVYADVALNYATYADMIAATPTYSDLVDKVSTNEVVVS